MASIPQNIPAQGLGDLPGELVLEITENMNLSDKFHLMCTCRGMYALIRDIIYDDDAASAEPRALRWACAHGLINIINEILDKGISIDHIFSQDACYKTSRPEHYLRGCQHACTPLTTAVAFRRLDVVKLLLQRGANANWRLFEDEVDCIYDEWRENGSRFWNDGQPTKTSLVFYSALHWAVNPQLAGVPEEQRGHEDELTEQIVCTLLEHGAYAESILDGYCLPLWLAIANPYVPVSIVRILLRILPETNIPMIEDGYPPPANPFHYFVVERFYDFPGNNRRSFISSVDEEKLELLLSTATDDGLIKMSQQGFLQLLETLPTPSMLETTRIFMRHLPHDLLVESFPSPKLPLMVAIRAFGMETAESFQEPDDWNLEDLCDAYMKLFSILIDGGAPLECPWDDSWRSADTALTALCNRQYGMDVPFEAFMNFFLSKGALPNGRDSRGLSALYYAAKHVLTRAAVILLSHASLPELSSPPRDFEELDINEEPKTMLVTACYAIRNATGNDTRVGFADLLIKSGAEVNVTTGSIPLIAACSVGDADLVRFLLERGADPNIYISYDRDLSISVLGRVVSAYTSIYRRKFRKKYWTPNGLDARNVMRIVEILLENGAVWPPGDRRLVLENMDRRRTFPEMILSLLNEEFS
ncbi:ankyrin repeat-containing domain protein [Nemania abortiva]|nr:ankyrin repeat-containing domain protein [Nemania abortiva]